MSRLCAIAVILAVALMATTPAVRADDRLSRVEAREAMRVAAAYIAQPFTESKPRIRVRCRLTAKDRARCRASVRGDRIDASFSARLRAVDGDVLVYAGCLRVRA